MSCGAASRSSLRHPSNSQLPAARSSTRSSSRSQHCASIRSEVGPAGQSRWPSRAFRAAKTLGAVLTERLLARVEPLRLLVRCAFGSLGFLALFICAPQPAIAAVALFSLGFCASSHYPLVKATAFELAPGQPGLVNAIAQLFVAIEIVLPLAVGAVASRFGLTVALAALAFEPFVIIAVAVRSAREASSPR